MDKIVDGVAAIDPPPDMTRTLGGASGLLGGRKDFIFPPSGRGLEEYTCKS